MKKILALVAALSLVMSVVASGSIAYLTSTDMDKNVMTMGNVSIEQKEYQDEDLTTEFVNTDLYPGQTIGKYVTVTNNGNSGAYVRTLVAFEKDEAGVIEFTKNTTDWTWGEKTYEAKIGGVDYTVYVVDYKNDETENVLTKDTTTPASLYTVSMKASATNDDIEAFGTEYTVLVLSQAVQTAGFESASAAFDAAFGVLTDATVASWFGEEVENLPITVTDAAGLQAALENAKTGDTIIFAADITADVVMPRDVENITIDGNDYKLNGFINLNGAKGATIKGLTFNAEFAGSAYDGRGNVKGEAMIVTGGADKPGRGAWNLTIDSCKFTGKFAEANVSIAFTDQSRGSGASGNVKIKNCTFDTENTVYDIYGYYTGNGANGYGDFVIEGNTFKTETQSKPIYLGRYASSTPVVVKGNTFENVTSLEDAMTLQDHGSYGVSISAENNTFAAASENP